MILNVLPVEGSTTDFDVVLADPIAPGQWTTLTAYVEGPHGLPIDETIDHVTIGFLPGDVDGSLTTSPLDLLFLIDTINGVRHFPVSRTDINRSQELDPSDILRLVDLLNGANTTRRWAGVQLPPRPD